MGFLNSKDEWQCQDPCLTSKNGQLCGKTDHFTNFALLLSGAGNQKGSDPCASSISANNVLPFLSLALILLAIAVVVVSVILIELRVRYVGFVKRNTSIRIEITE